MSTSINSLHNTFQGRLSIARLKRSSLFRSSASYERCYCILEDFQLKCYEDEDLTSHIGSIDIDKYTVSIPTGRHFSSLLYRRALKRTFDLISKIEGFQDLTVVADSVEAMHEWVYRLQEREKKERDNVLDKWLDRIDKRQQEQRSSSISTQSTVVDPQPQHYQSFSTLLQSISISRSKSPSLSSSPPSVYEDPITPPPPPPPTLALKPITELYQQNSRKVSTFV